MARSSIETPSEMSSANTPPATPSTNVMSQALINAKSTPETIPDSNTSNSTGLSVDASVHDKDAPPLKPFFVIVLNKSPSIENESLPEEIERRNALVRNNPASINNMIANICETRRKQEGSIREGEFTVCWSASPVPYHLGFLFLAGDAMCHHVISVRDRQILNPPQYARDLLPLAASFLRLPSESRKPHLPFYRPRPLGEQTNETLKQKTIQLSHMINSQHGSLSEISLQLAESTGQLLNDGKIDVSLLRVLTSPTTREEEIKISVPSMIVELPDDSENLGDDDHSPSEQLQKSKKPKRSKKPKKNKQQLNDSALSSGANDPGYISAGEPVCSSSEIKIQDLSQTPEPSVQNDVQNPSSTADNLNHHVMGLGEQPDGLLRLPQSPVLLGCPPPMDSSEDGRQPEMPKSPSDNVHHGRQEPIFTDALNSPTNRLETSKDSPPSPFKVQLLLETAKLKEEADMWKKVREIGEQETGHRAEPSVDGLVSKGRKISRRLRRKAALSKEAQDESTTLSALLDNETHEISRVSRDPGFETSSQEPVVQWNENRSIEALPFDSAPEIIRITQTVLVDQPTSRFIDAGDETVSQGYETDEISDRDPVASGILKATTGSVSWQTVLKKKRNGKALPAPQLKPDDHVSTSKKRIVNCINHQVDKSLDPNPANQPELRNREPRQDVTSEGNHNAVVLNNTFNDGAEPNIAAPLILRQDVTVILNDGEGLPTSTSSQSDEKCQLTPQEPDAESESEDDENTITPAHSFSSHNGDLERRVPAISLCHNQKDEQIKINDRSREVTAFSKQDGDINEPALEISPETIWLADDEEALSEKSSKTCTKDQDERRGSEGRPLSPPQVFRRGAQGLVWAYKTGKPQDQSLVDAGIFLFEKPRTYFELQPSHCKWRKSRAELFPAVVCDRTTNTSEAVVEFDGEVTHIIPHLDPWPDLRSMPYHPDFMMPPKLAEYQACELAGYQMWRHDRDVLQCNFGDCTATVSDAHPDTIFCVGCGPKTRIRYCSFQHQVDDLTTHWQECGSPSFLILRIIDHTTAPQHISYMCPAIKSIRHTRSFALHRQRLYAMVSDGMYSFFSPNTDNIYIISWPASDPDAREMNQRIERLLNIAFLDITNGYLINYLWVLIRYAASRSNFPLAAIKLLKHQFRTEFLSDELKTPINPPPPCECEWFGTEMGERPHSAGCVYETMPPQQCREERGEALWKVVSDYEGRYWILRAWNQQHPSVKEWWMRAKGQGFPGKIWGEGKYEMGRGWTGWGGKEDDICA